MLYCHALNEVKDKPAHRNVSTKRSIEEMVEMMTKGKENWKKLTVFFDDLMRKRKSRKGCAARE